jgi:hypothetical protein
MKTVLTFLATVHIAHQATRDSFPFSLFLLFLLILPLILIKLMNPSVETELAQIIFAGRNTAVPLSVKPICKNPLSNLFRLILCGFTLLRYSSLPLVEVRSHGTFGALVP